MTIRILLADDDATIRMLLKRLLEANPDWQICGEARDGIDAVQKVLQDSPDLIIMDLSMPRMNGLDAGREIAKLQPQLPMLLCTVQQIEEPGVHEICDAGFRGIVTKENGAEVVAGVQALLNGETRYFNNPFSSSGIPEREIRTNRCV